MSTAPRPTSISAATSPVFGSMRDTMPSAALVAHTDPCPKARPVGESTGTRSTTRLVSGLTLSTTSAAAVQSPEQTHKEPAPNVPFTVLAEKPLSLITASSPPRGSSLLRSMFAGRTQDANETATEPSTEEPGEPAEAEAEPASLQVATSATHNEPSPKPTGW